MVEWAELRLGRFEETKLFKKSWQRAGRTHGDYMPLGNIIMEEGG